MQKYGSITGATVKRETSKYVIIKCDPIIQATASTTDHRDELNRLVKLVHNDNMTLDDQDEQDFIFDADGKTVKLIGVDRFKQIKIPGYASLACSLNMTAINKFVSPVTNQAQ
jgi:hypothetical protein